MVLIRHFYHVWAAGAWAEPAVQHAEALLESGFRGHITVGLVGSRLDRAIARERIGSLLAELPNSTLDWAEADQGYEQVTLALLRSWVHAARGDQAVLYAHTKGAHNQSEMNAEWRRSMTRHVVGDWRTCVSLLRDYDTIGCHWLTPSLYPHVVGTPYYGGNFWWARASYLRRLPPLEQQDRHAAEGWIGLGDPYAYDLFPGWPSMQLLTGRSPE